jgi:hypothetical protein
LAGNSKSCLIIFGGYQLLEFGRTGYIRPLSDIDENIVNLQGLKSA